MKALDDLNRKLLELHEKIDEIDRNKRAALASFDAEIEAIEAEKKSVQLTLDVLTECRAELQDAFSTLALAASTGAATEADYRTFAETLGLTVPADYFSPAEEDEEEDEDATEKIAI